jgi:colanic acid biosynthesis glycosyl transferase WcaI
MRLLIITQYYWPENLRINDLTTDLVNRGHEVTVLTGVPNYPSGRIFPEFQSSPKSFLTFNGVKVIRVPIIPRGKRNIQLFFNYLSFIITASTIGLFRLRKQHFDAVFVFQPSPVTVCLPAVLYRYLTKTPVAFWVLDLWPETLKALGVVRSKRVLGLIGYLVSFIYNRNDLVLGQSKSFLPNIQKYCKHDNIRYFPGWAESVFSNGMSKSQSTGADDGIFNVTFTGNIGESQDFPAILDAAERLKNDKMIRWTIVGDGRMFHWVKDQVEKRGLVDYVSLEGRHPIEKMPYFFDRADVLLVSLKDEPIFSYTIPGKLQAYLKAGKPILGMLNGEGADLIRMNNCGITCKAGDSKGLVIAVRKLSQIPIEKRRVMGGMSLKLSETEFDRTKLIDKLESWLQQLASRKPLVP